MANGNGKKPESGKNGTNGKNGATNGKGKILTPAQLAAIAPAIDAVANPQADALEPENGREAVIGEPEQAQEAFIEDVPSTEEDSLPKPGTRTPERLIEQRVAFVGELWAIGTTTAAIRRNVAKAAQNERLQREKARTDRSRKTPFPAVVWGDVVPSDRTIDRLIERAKAECRLVGKNLSTAGEMLIGKMIGTLNVAAAMAVKNNDPRALIHAVETTARITGTMGALTIHLGGEKDGEPIQTQDVPVTDLTEEAVVDELAEMRRRAAERKRAAVENGEDTGTVKQA